MVRKLEVDCVWCRSTAGEHHPTEATTSYGGRSDPGPEGGMNAAARILWIRSPLWSSGSSRAHHVPNELKVYLPDRGNTTIRLHKFIFSPRMQDRDTSQPGRLCCAHT